MKYARPPISPELMAKINRVAQNLGFDVRGHKWRLLDHLLDYADVHPELFRNRS